MSQAEKKRQQIELSSYVLGLINILIFGKMLGDEGIAFFVLGLESFFFVSIVTMGSLTDTLGRILRSRNQKGKYISVHHIRRGVLLLQGCLGIISGVIFACCSGLIADKLFGVRYCTYLLMLMAPMIGIRNISAILNGFFQGEGTELPRAVIAPLRQLMVLGFGNLFVKMMQEYGTKVANLLGDSSYIAMYGSLGIGIAMLLAEILVVLFLGLITLGNRKKLILREERGMKQKESFAGIMRILYSSMGLGALIQIVGLLPLWMGAILYRRSITNVTGFAENYGVFAGKYLVICGVPVILISVLLITSGFRTVDAFRKEDYREAKRFFRGGIHAGMIHAIFWTVFVAVMAEHLIGMLSPQKGELAVQMLRYGSSVILFGTLLWYFVKQLLRMKKKYHVLGCLVFADLAFFVVYFVLKAKENMGVMILIYSSLAALFVGCVITGFVCCRILRCGIDWLRSVAIPAGASCLVGIVGMLMGNVLVPNFGNMVAVLLCFIVSVILYWVILIVFRCFGEQEVRYVPGGALIAGLNRLFGIF